MLWLYKTERGPDTQGGTHRPPLCAAGEAAGDALESRAAAEQPAAAAAEPAPITPAQLSRLTQGLTVPEDLPPALMAGQRGSVRRHARRRQPEPRLPHAAAEEAPTEAAQPATEQRTAASGGGSSAAPHERRQDAVQAAPAAEAVAAALAAEAVAASPAAEAVAAVPAVAAAQGQQVAPVEAAAPAPAQPPAGFQIPQARAGGKAWLH